MDKPAWTNCPVMEQRNGLIVKKDVGSRVVLIQQMLEHVLQAHSKVPGEGKERWEQSFWESEIQWDSAFRSGGSVKVRARVPQMCQ